MSGTLNKKYYVARYGRWHWGILYMPSSKPIFLRVGLHNADYSKSLDDAENKLLLFNKKDEAIAYCEKLEKENQ